MNERWSFNVDNLGTVRVADSLIKSLSKYRQVNNSQPESGGVLMGSYLNSNGALLIDNYTVPQKEDRQGRHSFYRSEAHDALVKDIWKKSDHKTTYLGLWHTHPEPIPNYSHVDANDWRNALNTSRYDGNFLFFFIVGTSSIRCWVGERRRFRNSIKLVSEVQVAED